LRSSQRPEAKPHRHLEQVLAEHEAIADLIEARKPARAERALRDHLRRSDY